MSSFGVDEWIGLFFSHLNERAQKERNPWKKFRSITEIFVHSFFCSSSTPSFISHFQGDHAPAFPASWVAHQCDYDGLHLSLLHYCWNNVV